MGWQVALGVPIELRLMPLNASLRVALCAVGDLKPFDWCRWATAAKYTLTNLQAMCELRYDANREDVCLEPGRGRRCSHLQNETYLLISAL